jgi:hypothetical protein
MEKRQMTLLKKKCAKESSLFMIDVKMCAFLFPYIFFLTLNTDLPKVNS